MYMNDQLISVIVPVYNAGQYLRTTIESILNQTYKNIEVILVNDGSNDNSQNIIDDYRERDSRIISIVTENYGAPHARNIGLDSSNGSYVVFFDADDLMLPEEVDLLASGFEDGIDLVIGSRYKITEKGKRFRSDILRDGIYDPQTSDIHYLINLSPFPDNKLFSKKVLLDNNVRFHNVRIAQDANLYLKYLSVCGKVKIISEIVCLYRVVNNSISHSYNNKVIDIIKNEENIETFVKEHGANSLFFSDLYEVFIKYCKSQIMKIGFMEDKKTRAEVLDKIGNYVLLISEENNLKNKQALHSVQIVKRMLMHRKWYTSSAYCLYRKSKKGLRKLAVRLCAKKKL